MKGSCLSSLLAVTLVFTPGFSYAQKAPAAACSRVASIETQIKAHPTAGLYAQSGDWFRKHHRPQCAALDYASAVLMEPKSASLFLLLGTSLFEAGDLEASEQALRESIRIGPQTAEQHEKLAQLLEQRRLPDEAKAEWAAALRIAPRSSAALDGMAKHLIAEGNYAGAIKLLQGVPLDNELLALDLVQAYGRGGSLEIAEKTAREARERHPESFPITYTLTTILVDQGKFQEASKLSERYATAHPRNIEAQHLFLHLLITTNDSKRASPLAKKLLAQRPMDDYFLYVNGRLEQEAGEYAAARSHLEQSIRLNSSSTDAHYQLGLALVKLNVPEAARSQFEQAIKLGLREPEVHFQLAKVLRTLGKPEEAEQELRLYKNLVDSQSKEALAQGKAALAQKELDAGNTEKAVGLFREALSTTPDNALLQFQLGMALDKLGDLASEKAALEKAIELDGDMAIAHNQLGFLFSQAGDVDSAEEHYREAVRAAPAYTQAWINLAATLAMESKIPEAQQAVARALQTDPSNVEAQQLQQQLESQR